MRTEFNYNNSHNFVFHSFNQRKHKKYHYCCPVFAPFININTNCRITHNIDLTRDDLDKVIKIMVQAWKLILEKDKNWFAGGLWLDWVNYTLSYIKKEVQEWRKNISGKKWIVPDLSTFYSEDEEELLKWINRGYTALIWFSVNSEFIKDAIDWKIEKFEDYEKYKWVKWNKLNHFTNTAKWLRIWKWWEKYWQEFILDSYAHNLHNLERVYWNFNIKEALEDLTFRSKYIFH